MKYSRIYQFTSTTITSTEGTSSESNITVRHSAPDSNADEAHEVLFEKLRSVFLTHGRRQFGFFDPAPEATMASALGDYYQQKTNAASLGEHLSSQYRAALPAREQNLNEALFINDYLWMIIDESGDSEVLYLFLLQHDDSHHITPALTVSNGPSLFTNRLQYAARIHLNDWMREDSKTYLSFLAPKNQHPQTLAWNALLGFSEGIDRAAKTEEFLGTLEHYATTLAPEKAQETRDRVIDYCMDQSRQGKPVELQALSEHVDESAPSKLLDFMKERIEEPADELYTDRNKLKRYTRFYGRDQDLSIGFSTAMLGSHIAYDENSDTLTIKAIPKSLKSQLKQYLKK